MSWKRLSCKCSEVQLVGTLNGGQSFRWKFDSESNEWTGIFAGIVWKLIQDDEGILYKILGSLNQQHASHQQTSKNIRKTKHNSTASHTETRCFFESLLIKYFRLETNLTELYEDWAKRDKLFSKASEQFYGIRMLDQDPVENLFSFICSQNNHISRISSMIEKLCVNYGEKICEIDEMTYYSFPSVVSISEEKVEANLRELGFGYRAKFIQKSASMIQEWGGAAWFQGLKDLPYLEAKSELLKLPGIGPKVADCVCLMSLNHLEALPVDTHVFQIASQHYLPQLKGMKSVTDRVYNEIANYFRTLYGPKAGWAHTVLFCADLKKFEQPGTKRICDNTTTKTKKKRKSNCSN